MKLFAWVFLVAIFCNANAGWINEQGISLPDAEDRKGIGDFGAQLVFVADEQALFKTWATPSKMVNLKTVESITINQPISAFVIFSGCKPTATGECNISMRFRVFQPDGKVYSETPAMEVWQHKPAPRGRTLELSVQYLKIVVEPHEQRGRYTVQTQVRDDNSGAVFSLQKAFTATDAQVPERHSPEAGSRFQSQKEVSQWLTFYYQKPEPDRLSDFITYMSMTGALDNPNTLPPIFGFLSGTFRNNPNRVSSWVNQLSYLKEQHLGVVVLGLWYAALPNSQKMAYAIIEKHPKLKPNLEFLYKGAPMTIEQIPLEQGPWVLDALWGSFMATGSSTPVERIITTLPWSDVKGDINRLLVGGSARWSLTSNAVQHKRVLEICEGVAKTQSTEVAAKLGEVIADAKKKLKARNNSVNTDASR